MEYHCVSCESPCEVRVVNNGIGKIEVWGAIVNDESLDLESVCCGGDVTDQDGMEISAAEYENDLEDGRADHARDEAKDREFEVKFNRCYGCDEC